MIVLNTSSELKLENQTNKNLLSIVHESKKT